MTDTVQACASSDLAELASLCEERAHVYRLLSRIFESEIDAPFAEHLAQADAFSTEDEAMAELFSHMVEDLGDRGEAALEDLAVDYDRVFFGMGPLTAEKAFPYESVYTSEGGLMMQDAFAEVKHEYRRFGWEKNPAFPEPDDHVAVELLFMARCSTVAAEALAEGDEQSAEASLIMQRTFIDAHLLNWIDRFAFDVSRASKVFYGHAAGLLVAFVKADRAVVEEVLA